MPFVRYLAHVPVHVTKPCRECNKLEIEYQAAIGEIHSVVYGRFNTVGEKLRELFRWQDVRDNTVKTIHKHKKTHAPTEPSRRLATNKPSEAFSNRRHYVKK